MGLWMLQNMWHYQNVLLLILFELNIEQYGSTLCNIIKLESVLADGHRNPGNIDVQQNIYGSGHEAAAVLLSGFAIIWPDPYVDGFVQDIGISISDDLKIPPISIICQWCCVTYIHNGFHWFR